jgi:hypothetical protein
LKISTLMTLMIGITPLSERTKNVRGPWLSV